jgi:hypothetical protein
MVLHRLLFSSIHSYLDPSSDAALATRELLEVLGIVGVGSFFSDGQHLLPCSGSQSQDGNREKEKAQKCNIL